MEVLAELREKMVPRSFGGPASHPRRQLLAIVATVVTMGLIASCAAIPGTPLADDAGQAGATGSSAAAEPIADPAEEPGDAVASSRELIAAALAAGDIDEPTSWLYRTWAAFDAGLLPDEFFGADDGHDTELLTQLPTVMAELPDDIREQIEPYFLRPTDPTSIYGADYVEPPGLRSRTDSVRSAPRNLAAGEISSKCRTGWDTVMVPGVHMRVWACLDMDRGSNETAAAMKTISDVLAEYVPKMIADMGPLIPDDSSKDPDPRADDRVDFYIVPPRTSGPSYQGRNIGSAQYAYAASTAPTTSKTASSYVAFNWTMLGDPGLVERAVVHEMFHVLQYTHFAFMDSRWYYDASAEWAAAHYVRHDARRLHQVRLPVLQNADPQLLQNPFGMIPYGAYLWPLFIEQEVGAAAVFGTWTALANLTGSSNDDAVIRVFDQFLDVEGVFPEFVMRMYNPWLPGNPVSKRFRHLDPNFPDGQRPDRPALILDDEMLKIPYKMVFGTGWQYNLIEVIPPPDAGPDDEVFVTILGELSNKGGGAPTLEALVRKGDGSFERQEINYTGDGTRVCVSQELILVMTNQAHEGSNSADGIIGLERDEEPGCSSIEVTHPQTGDRLADSGDIVTVAGQEEDDEPDVMPLVISVFDVPRPKIGDFTVEVELAGGTLFNKRELSWPLSDFAAGPNDSYVLETAVDLDIDLTDANRPMTYDATLFENQKKVDDHVPTALLHGEEQDTCLIGEWILPESEMQKYYRIVQQDSTLTVSGSTGIAFTEDEYSYTPGFNLHMEFPADTLTISAVAAISGEVTGRYQADGEIITTSHEKNNISVLVHFAGQTIDGTEMFGDFMAMSPVASAPYECTDNGPVLMYDTGGGARFPMGLVPAP